MEANTILRLMMVNEQLVELSIKLNSPNDDYFNKYLLYLLAKISLVDGKSLKVSDFRQEKVLGFLWSPSTFCRTLKRLLK